MATQHPEPIVDRITRLEEGQTFSERTVDQLSEEMAAVNRRLGELVQRLERIETRFTALEEAVAAPAEETQQDEQTPPFAGQ